MSIDEGPCLEVDPFKLLGDAGLEDLSRFKWLLEGVVGLKAALRGEVTRDGPLPERIREEMSSNLFKLTGELGLARGT